MAKSRSMSDLLRVPAGGIDVRSVDAAATPAADGGGKRAGAKMQVELAPRLADLQEKLFANGRTGGDRSVLLVLQGLDTSGKSGTIKHVIGQIDPQGAQVSAFKEPTPEERRHSFLWRINKRLPEPGHDRCLRPLALRGGSRCARPQPRPPLHLVASLRRDQPLRAGRRGERHDDHQVL